MTESRNPVTTVRLTVDPQQTPREEAELVARVAAAIAESTGEDNVVVELESSEHVRVPGTTVADRMQGSARWSA
jgi:phenylpyruvate tautomerase PptA (4-oxalocrotonate tautomerase family)